MQKPCKKMANGNNKVKAIFVRGTHSAGNSIPDYQTNIILRGITKNFPSVKYFLQNHKELK